VANINGLLVVVVVDLEIPLQIVEKEDLIMDHLLFLVVLLLVAVLEEQRRQGAHTIQQLVEHMQQVAAAVVDLDFQALNHTHNLILLVVLVVPVS
jgi:hypothetical protein